MKKSFMYIISVIVCFFGFACLVSAENSINDGMSQTEIDEVMGQGGAVNVLPGDYQFKIVRSTVNNTTIYLGNKGATESSYTSLRIITEAETDVRLLSNVVMDGAFNSNNSLVPVAIFARKGNTLVNADEYVLTIKNYAGGMRLGEHKNVKNRVNASLVIASGEVIVESSVAVGERNDDGVPVGAAATGGGIFIYSESKDVKYQFKVTNAKFAVRNLENGIGIYRLNYDTSDVSYTDGSSTIVFDNAEVIIQNAKSGYSAFVDEGFYSDHVVLLIKDSKLSLIDNAKNGYTGADNRRNIQIINSEVIANGNAAAGMKFDCQKIDIINSKLYASGNGSFGFTGMSNATVKSSTISTVDNRLAGMVFYGNSIVSDNSKLLSKKDGDRTYSSSRSSAVAVRIYPGTFTVVDSVTNFDSVSGISFYNTSAGNVRVYVTGETVAAISANDEFNTTASELFDDFNASKQNTGRTIVIGGSLQASFENMTVSEKLKLLKDSVLNPVISFENGEKEDTQYLAPVNSDGTALTRFDLNSEINKEVGGEGSHTFVYYDPNTSKEYVYTFRYNVVSEDLVEGESGNAYVWTPVSEITYDATEGVVVTDGSTALIDDTNSRYARDITIFGNSLDLAERVMPSAVRQGYKFLGWFIAVNGVEVDLEKAYALANDGNFNELYALLNYKFEQNSKVLAVVDDVKSGIERITVFAKWAKESQVIVHHVDTEGNTLADDETLNGYVGSSYETTAKEIKDYHLYSKPENANGEYVEEVTHVTYVYDKDGMGNDNPPHTGVDNKTNWVSFVFLAALVLVKKILVRL